MCKNQLWEKIAGSSFGVVFICVMLILNVRFPNPTDTQYETFKVVLSLAAAGIGGIFFGFINIKGTFKKIGVRAGGALALFIIIYFMHPCMPNPQLQINQISSGNNSTFIGEVKSGGTVNINRSNYDTINK